jgi:hypothetical protein
MKNERILPLAAFASVALLAAACDRHAVPSLPTAPVAAPAFGTAALRDSAAPAAPANISVAIILNPTLGELAAAHKGHRTLRGRFDRDGKRTSARRAG